MLGNRLSGRSTRVLSILAAAAALALQGCATQTMVVEEQYDLYLRTLTAKRDQPLARTLTWKHQYTAGKMANNQTWFIVDGKLVRNPKELANVQMLAAQPSSSGWKTSDLYAQQARNYQSKGQTGMARAYQSASTVSAQTQIASERVATGIALGNAIQGLGTAALDYVVTNSATGAVKYIQSSGVIGERAPEGSVLELFFRSTRWDGAEAKPGQILMQWETVATLKDADGKIWRSGASFKNYIIARFGSEAAPVPAELASDGHFRLDPTSGLPMGNAAQYGAEAQELGKIITGGGNLEFGLTAVRAVQDIYEQKDAGRKSARR